VLRRPGHVHSRAGGGRRVAIEAIHEGDLEKTGAIEHYRS
jgi:hypothetical protein